MEPVCGRCGNRHPAHKDCERLNFEAFSAPIVKQRSEQRSTAAGLQAPRQQPEVGAGGTGLGCSDPACGYRALYEARRLRNTERNRAWRRSKQEPWK